MKTSAADKCRSALSPTQLKRSRTLENAMMLNNAFGADFYVKLGRVDSDATPARTSIPQTGDDVAEITVRRARGVL